MPGQKQPGLCIFKCVCMYTHEGCVYTCVLYVALCVRYMCIAVSHGHGADVVSDSLVKFH